MQCREVGGVAGGMVAPDRCSKLGMGKSSSWLYIFRPQTLQTHSTQLQKSYVLINFLI